LIGKLADSMDPDNARAFVDVVIAEAMAGHAPKLFAVVEEMRRHTDPMGGASGRMVGQWADAIAAVRGDMVTGVADDRR
jgi:hypothetical protein